MLFSLFVRNADMPAGLSFLLIFFMKVTMFALANALIKSGNALWRFRTSSRKANHCGVFHSFLSKKLVR